MNRSGALKIGFLLALLALCAVLSGVGLRFALPRSEWVEIGELADYPPAQQPYEIFSPMHLFLVNDGDQLLVLDPLNRVAGGFGVRWNSREGAFIDPNRGSWFNLQGRPVRRAGINSLVERQSLPRYEYRIETGRVWVNLSRSAVETVIPALVP